MSEGSRKGSANSDARRRTGSQDTTHFDAIVIGSGFAGAVTFRRLIEAKFRACILERGRRYEPRNDFPVHPFRGQRPNVPYSTNGQARTPIQPDASRLTWSRDRGLWEMRDVGDVVVGQAAGWGGGSLIYANVHLRPAAHVFDERWPIKKDDLDDYYDLVAHELHVSPLPARHRNLPKSVQLERFATSIPGPKADNRESYLEWFWPPLTVNFDRCDLQGNCWFGCRNEGAKNTLDENYLREAEKSKDATVITCAEVVWIAQREGKEGTGFEVEYNDVSPGPKQTRKLTADFVFVCAGAVNTTELLMRSKAARKLNITGSGLGKCFHPNQDSVNMVFDCDDPHELDRGPTITGSLLYDRLPEEGDADARWRLRFTGADREPRVDEVIVCDVDGKSSYATVASPAYLLSGSYGRAKGALGEVVIRAVTTSERESLGLGESVPGPESFQVGGALSIRAQQPNAVVKQSARRNGNAGKHHWAVENVRPLRHWLLIQDGGISAELGSTIGSFRSPLWLRRNGFAEPPGPFEKGKTQREDRKHSAVSQKPDFAEFPVQALTDVVSSITRGAGSQLQAVTNYGLLQAFTDPGSEDTDDDGYRVIPTQLRESLEDLRRQVLDDIGLGAEGVVATFLDEAAETMAPQIEKALTGIDNNTWPDVIKEGPNLAEEVVKVALRLGVQLIWGSQGELARAVAEHAASVALPSQQNLVKLGLNALKRALDYRLENGHNTAVLTMGLDSMPGTLHLDLPWELELGDTLRGESSGQTAFVLEKLGDSPSSEDADRAEMLAVVSGEFVPGEMVYSASKVVGTFHSTEPSSEHSLGDTGIQVLKFVLKGAVGDEKPLSLIENVAFRAELPATFDTPERGIAERILRDIASGWGGELRTDPQWTFFNKRVTVHPQGGCPMQSEKDDTSAERFGVTEVSGEVRGCEGLYVMDAAAFPGPVGANPSATIAAVAEYKIVKFLESQKSRADASAALERLEKARQYARGRIDEDRSRLDPLGPGGVARPTGNSRLPYHRPVGIVFEETMTGTAFQEKEQESNAQGKTRLDGETQIDVSTDLKVRIDDLASFLARHERDSRVEVPIAGGHLTVGESGETGEGSPTDSKGGAGTQGAESEATEETNIDTERSFMRIMANPSRRDERGQLRTIEYRLVTKDGRYRLEGVKTIRDDPGPDLLDDTTTLGFRLFEYDTESRNEVRRFSGTLTLYVEELFRNQIPGFTVTTDDPVRQAWAMASFLRFFAGNLVEIYVPSLRSVRELAASLTRRAHA